MGKKRIFCCALLVTAPLAATLIYALLADLCIRPLLFCSSHHDKLIYKMNMHSNNDDELARSFHIVIFAIFLVFFSLHFFLFIFISIFFLHFSGA